MMSGWTRAAKPSTTAPTTTACSTDITFRFGISNKPHFSRVFRTHLGVTPSDFRRATGGLPG
jgi:transcriptional regulator GlxA family with amidase domain